MASEVFHYVSSSRPIFSLLMLHQAFWPPSCPLDSPNTSPAQARATAHGWAVCALNKKPPAEGTSENRHAGFCLPRQGPGLHPLRGVIFSNQHTWPCSGLLYILFPLLLLPFKSTELTFIQFSAQMSSERPPLTTCGSTSLYPTL